MDQRAPVANNWRMYSVQNPYVAVVAWLLVAMSLLLLCVFTAGCNADVDKSHEGNAGGATVQMRSPPKTSRHLPSEIPQLPSAQVPARKSEADTALPPPSTEALARADKLVAFANAASLALASGKYAQTDVLAAYTEYYLAEWQLAKHPRVDNEADALLARRLKPPTGLFSVEQEKQLAVFVKAMDKAIADMRSAYRSLEAYVKDTSIRDDGVRGRQLGERILGAHAAYIAARDGWIHIVETASGPAEELLLRDHPLRRQIQAASRIFAVHRRVTQVLALPQPDMGELARLQEDLEAGIEEGGKPPFRAKPSVERTYRHFLREASSYKDAIARGIAEGFHGDVREEMNRAALSGRTSYNEFVRVANE